MYRQWKLIKSSENVKTNSSTKFPLNQEHNNKYKKSENYRKIFIYMSSNYDNHSLIDNRLNASIR